MNFRIVAGHIMLWGAIFGALVILNIPSDEKSLLFFLAFFWVSSAMYLVIARQLLCKSEKDRIIHELEILNLKLERAKLKKEFKSIQSNLNSR